MLTGNELWFINNVFEIKEMAFPKNLIIVQDNKEEDQFDLNNGRLLCFVNCLLFL